MAATFSLLILLYALLAAYITGGGSLLSGLLPAITDAEGVGDLLKCIKAPTNRLTLTPLTFISPLAFALFYPDGFIAALGYAGLLFGFYGMILPIGMAWRMRKLHPNLPYRVAGGGAALLIALACGVIIMAIPFLIQAGLLPSVTG